MYIFVNSLRLSLANPNSGLPLELPLEQVPPRPFFFTAEPFGLPPTDSLVFFGEVLGLASAPSVSIASQEIRRIPVTNVNRQ